MSMQEAAIAANRFGLGARPGELAELAADPRGWLLAQLVPETELPAPLRALPTTAEDQVAFFVWLRDYQKQARRAAATGDAAMTRSATTPATTAMNDAATMDNDPMSGATGAVNVEQSYVQALLPVYARAVAARIETAVATRTPFRERLIHFWSNHFVVSAAKPSAIALGASYERDIARRFVVGRFADMLLAAEQHPAMLLFLDNTQSIGPNSRWGRDPSRVPDNPIAGRPSGLNENLAREILELHTLGVDGGYSQADVTAFARTLTGWQIANPFKQLRLKRFVNWSAQDFFYFNADAHEPGPHTVLARSYADSGEGQGEAVLRDLAVHPSTARFIATKLARHFTGDTPPPPLVERLAACFRDNDGDLCELARVLVNAPEAWQPAPLKFKTPENYLLSSLRALGGPPLTSTQVLALLNDLGQRSYWPPGPDGWHDREADWLGPDALWKRMQWAELAGRATAGAHADPLALADAVLGPDISASTRSAIRNAESAAQGLTLLLCSPEFMRR